MIYRSDRGKEDHRDMWQTTKTESETRRGSGRKYQILEKRAWDQDRIV